MENVVRKSALEIGSVHTVGNHVNYAPTAGLNLVINNVKIVGRSDRHHVKIAAGPLILPTSNALIVIITPAKNYRNQAPRFLRRG